MKKKGTDFGSRSSPDDLLSDIVRDERLRSFVDFVSGGLITSESRNGELSLDHSWKLRVRSRT